MGTKRSPSLQQGSKATFYFYEYGWVLNLESRQVCSVLPEGDRVQRDAHLGLTLSRPLSCSWASEPRRWCQLVTANSDSYLWITHILCGTPVTAPLKASAPSLARLLLPCPGPRENGCLRFISHLRVPPLGALRLWLSRADLKVQSRQRSGYLNLSPLLVTHLQTS